MSKKENVSQELELTADMFLPLSEDEKDTEFVAMESKTYFKDAWDRFKKNKMAMAGLIVLGVMVVLAIVGPMILPYSYETQDLSATNQGSSLQHLLGTDKFGRDMLTRILYGARISLSIGFAAAAINVVIGVVYGGISGYVGGKLDTILMRIVDILYSIPSLLYVILIMLVFGPSVTSILIGICVSSWIGMARVVRAQVLMLKQQEFSLAAKVLGANSKRILFKHLIINSMGPIIVNATLMIPSAIFTEAYLSFVGVGISIPQASWGTLAQNAKQVMSTYPTQLLYPVLAICITMFALNFIGDGLSDALDPKKK